MRAVGEGPAGHPSGLNCEAKHRVYYGPEDDYDEFRAKYSTFATLAEATAFVAGVKTSEGVTVTISPEEHGRRLLLDGLLSGGVG